MQLTSTFSFSHNSFKSFSLSGLLTLSQTTTEFVDDNFKFDEDDRKFSRWMENTIGKGEIAC